MSAFQFQGGNAIGLPSLKITANTVTDVIDTAGIGTIRIVRFEVNETAGATPNLTVELYDNARTLSYYLGDTVNNLTWKARPVTAYQSVKFEAGFVLDHNWKLRVTSSNASGGFDVIGIKIGR